MLRSGLLALRRHALRRGASSRSLAWIAIGVAAHLVHRALRDDEPRTTLRVRPGETLTVSVREDG